MRSSFFILLGLVVFFLAAGITRAGEPTVEHEPAAIAPGWDGEFRQGAKEIQCAAGGEISFQDTSPGRPNLDYALAVIRLGCMLDSVRGRGWLRGNDEVMIEAMGGPIYTGPGTALGGASLIYRRNFVPLSSRFEPYINIGVGAIYSDAYHQPTQHALGSAFEFDLQAGAGVRYRLDRRWSLDLETSYRHLSNAGLASRNYGTNALGGLLGVSYSL